MLTQEEYKQQGKACVCPHCGSRNTSELEPPGTNIGEVYWNWECHNCGKTYAVQFKVAGFEEESI